MSVSDLTGTTWVLNDNFSATAGYGTFQVSYNFIPDGSITPVEGSCLGIGYAFIQDTSTFPPMPPAFTATSNSIADQWNVSIQSTGGGTLEFIDGISTDVTNQSLISWLEANATQVLPEVYIKGIKIGNTTYPIAVSKLLSSDTEYNLEVKPLSLGGNTYGIVSAQESVSLIEFTVVGITYQAEDNMTWADWVSSQYNTNGTYINPTPPTGGDVHFAGSSSVLYVDRRQKVDAFDGIIEGWDYIPF